MNKIFVVTDEAMALHKPRYFHVERPERLQSILDLLNSDSELRGRVEFIQPKKAAEENILLVHSKTHYDYVVASVSSGKDVLDEGDTYACDDSLVSALFSAGCVVAAVDEIFSNRKEKIFCAVRPPGHHAESNRVMGFCLFNNIAIGAAYAINKYALNKVAIIDWDVHHGNGTQEIFYKRNDVLFISLHQHPLYPGTGMHDETGKDGGKNFTMNFPLPAMTGFDVYENIFLNEIVPAVTQFQPQLVMISAGFDAHKNDPISNMDLSENDFGRLTKIIAGFCSENSIPIISVLEGGYDLTALRDSVKQHLLSLFN